MRKQNCNNSLFQGTKLKKKLNPYCYKKLGRFSRLGLTQKPQENGYDMSLIFSEFSVMKKKELISIFLRPGFEKKITGPRYSLDDSWEHYKQ